ncbi:CubicO group peptidase (beta-lactamase class C family) [Pelomonas saccharophila]|uniref:CubicO group peptidase (Beta-lactamase class C family) n=1 Tax=Roseateles saccharophilus TaxID=304 RepID=A0ABU1YQI4_ROSSA|nr:serine hydrolase domain-containing protein [Roseateles saccharophilus]MDR7271127.1 CubicO group peptidase (beta-lactamase class C family) [Roseateles saccharophilus]
MQACVATRILLIRAAFAAALLSGLQPAHSADAVAAPSAASSAPAPSRGSVLFWNFEQQKAGYPHMEDLYPARLVKRGAVVTPLPVAAKPLEVSFKVGDETWSIDDYMSRNRAAGLLVLKDGEVVLERYGLGQTPQMRWTSFSVAKSFSSTLVGAAIRDGRIKSLEDPITAYLPGLKGSAYEGVTVRQVLNMTSGARWNEDYGDPKSDVARFGSEPSVNGSDPVVTYMARLPREAAPGTQWVYKTGETNLVGSLLRAATGKTLSDYLSEKLWQPLGMEGDAYWMLDSAGAEIAGCCLSATLRDYGRFALFFMHGARLAHGQQVVPESWVEQATTTTREATEGLQGRGGYGLQWWTTRSKAYRASGIFGQGMWIDPELNLVVVTQSAWPGATDVPSAQIRQALIDAIAAQYRKH